jgi:hypothetical protein
MKGAKEKKKNSENVWYFQQRELSGLNWQPNEYLLIGITLLSPTNFTALTCRKLPRNQWIYPAHKTLAPDVENADLSKCLACWQTEAFEVQPGQSPTSNVKHMG